MGKESLARPRSVYALYSERQEGGMEVQEEDVTETETGRGKLQKEVNEAEEWFLASLFYPVSSFRLITAVPGREINGHNWPLKTSCLPL